METLEEFDRECPLSMMFCKRLTEDEFEAQTLTYTEKALQELFHTMDQNPKLCEKVVRRRKQTELEKAGLKSLVKAKFFSAVDGHMNRCNAVGTDELQERLGHLKEEMKKVHSYCTEAKRTSKRLAEKRQREREGVSVNPSASLGQQAAMVPPPPPPPPPPPVPSTDKLVFKTPFRDQTNLCNQENIEPATPDLLESYGLAKFNRRCQSFGNLKSASESDHSSQPVKSIHSELLAANHFKRLRTTGIHRSPGGTPSKTPRSLALEEEVNSPASAFNATLLNKFRNTKSPAESMPRSPSTSDSENSAFATPSETP
ncbi:mitochondrial fission regulator 1-like [Callorhinchus milii]|uniref:mitochondrial fission regulator 1-like n=1 Tax=Callorhinchus milii TaxID=7868 RepID=UPI001C3F69E4|nr:mitochondrial fission regulator 1-like [Callorhinchus milii]XP_042193484.1 mitochondrial fission regulator 1-like [Callorhinchus milii]XP_042193485.1 mitochondrial fission regulator 1-like [Callorhinchus milii]